MDYIFCYLKQQTKAFTIIKSLNHFANNAKRQFYKPFLNAKFILFLKLNSGIIKEI